MAKKTTEELQTELQEIVTKHNQALELVNQCKIAMIKLQAIIEDRQSGVVIPDTAPVSPVAPPPVP